MRLHRLPGSGLGLMFGLKDTAFKSCQSPQPFVRGTALWQLLSQYLPNAKLQQNHPNADWLHSLIGDSSTNLICYSCAEMPCSQKTSEWGCFCCYCTVVSHGRGWDSTSDLPLPLWDMGSSLRAWWRWHSGCSGWMKGLWGGEDSGSSGDVCFSKTVTACQCCKAGLFLPVVFLPLILSWQWWLNIRAPWVVSVMMKS